ncbi:hypothetical protein C4K29_3805 [Pseudomonas chlororaphis subsp. piscium]|uniref:hypothetical protein n=1 Tax=Pseudomonas chlororaphis TaxID=587753 RepID=UPI000F58578C|nr:hypothetical protein [Pseudomonas chlororaphis]AZC90104.1 hypothetical protein C4K29_3805 [Pseudomonas chlororaphis subsp. piscium]
MNVNVNAGSSEYSQAEINRVQAETNRAQAEANRTQAQVALLQAQKPYQPVVLREKLISAFNSMPTPQDAGGMIRIERQSDTPVLRLAPQYASPIQGSNADKSSSEVEVDLSMPIRTSGAGHTEKVFGGAIGTEEQSLTSVWRPTALDVSSMQGSSADKPSSEVDMRKAEQGARKSWTTKIEGDVRKLPKQATVNAESYQGLSKNGNPEKLFFHSIASAFTSVGSDTDFLKEKIREGINPSQAGEDSKLHRLYLKAQRDSKEFTDHVEKLFNEHYERSKPFKRPIRNASLRVATSGGSFASFSGHIPPKSSISSGSKSL